MVLAPQRHGAIDPGPHRHRLPPGDILAELGRDLDGEGEFAGPHAPLQLIVVPDRPVLDEVAGGAGNIQGIVVADGRLVAVQHGKGEMLHIQAEAIPYGEKQDHAAQEGQGQPDGVPAQFQALAWV